MMTLPKTLYIILAAACFFASCALRGPEQYYFGSYSEAERFYNKGEYEKAIEKYKFYQDENPEGNLAVISQYYIGKSYAALGKMDQAKDAYEKIVKEHPDLVWANFADNQLKEMSVRGEGAAAAGQS